MSEADWRKAKLYSEFMLDAVRGWEGEKDKRWKVQMRTALSPPDSEAATSQTLLLLIHHHPRNMASSSTAPLVVCTRKLPITLLHEAEQRGEIQLRCWDKADQPVERAWLLDNVKGASAVLIMMSDKVSRFAVL